MVYLAVITPIGLSCSRYQEVGMYVKEAYRNFEAAGRVHFKVPFPMAVETCLMWGSYSAHVMRGELDDPGDALRMKRDKELLDFMQRNGLLQCAQLWESCWEPRHSMRVTCWDKRLADEFLFVSENKPQVKVA
jgi:hypothetical protein